jgi:hypothetical protein
MFEKKNGLRSPGYPGYILKTKKKILKKWTQKPPNTTTSTYSIVLFQLLFVLFVGLLSRGIQYVRLTSINLYLYPVIISVIGNIMNEIENAVKENERQRYQRRTKKAIGALSDETLCGRLQESCHCTQKVDIQLLKTG